MIKDDLEKLKAFRSNLTEKNITDLTILIEKIKQELPEQYKNKLRVLKFFETINDAPSIDDLPF